jgi:glycosyltransferase involved in cell wall biosynthesis
MTTHSLNQYLEAALVGDATTDHAFMLQRWLREMGIDSQIYAEYCQPELERSIKSARSYRSKKQEGLLIYHHAIGSRAAQRLIDEGQELILIYQNITPPEFFNTLDPAMARQMALGREQLAALRQQTKLAIGASDYSEKELKEFGYSHTGVIPIVLNEKEYQVPANEKLFQRFRDYGPILLFVGRIVPNKKQEDLIKLLYYYRRIEPNAILLLVGGHFPPGYTHWIKDLSIDLGLDQAVIYTDHLSLEEMSTYYQLADFFVSMSEHEGFCKPLIESMYFNLPVIAFKAAAIPYTMAGSGVLFQHKDFEALAELIDVLNKNSKLRQQIVSGQNRRLADFLEANVRDNFEQQLKSLQIL